MDIPAATARAFLSQSTGLEVTRTQNLTPHQKVYLHYIQQKADSVLETARDLFRDAAGERLDGDRPYWQDRVFSMLAEIASCVHDTHLFTIDSAIQHLITTGHLADVSHDADLHARSRNLVFVALSWITMLYTPATVDLSSGCFQIDAKQMGHVNIPKQDLDAASRPICQLIQRFGPSLPVNMSNDQLHSPNPVVDTLYVTLLNASTLTRIGLIEICWVDNLSSHLYFDIENLTLMMFRIPSYCHVHQFDGSILDR